MIGPGTGVAPFIGMVQERTNQIMHLYYGCRRESDFIYRDEIMAAEKNGVQVNVAYSKLKGKYVQDLLKENKEKTEDVINKGGKIFICGSTTMGKDVQNLLKDWFGEEFVKGNRVLSEYWGGASVKFEARQSKSINLEANI